MLWQLIKRDPAWITIRWGLPLMVAVGLLDTRMMFFTLFVAGVLTGSFPQLHATRFQASLPISAPTLLRARLCSLMAGVWLPITATAAMAVLFQGKSPLPFFQAAVLYSAVVAAFQSYRLRELGGPWWMSFAILSLSGSVPLLLRSAAATPAIVVSAVLGVALTVRNLIAVPPAFQALPAAGMKGAATHEVASRRTASTGASWKPIVYSLLPWQNLVFLPMLAGGGFSGQTINNWFFIVVMWGMARQNLRWLVPLPIRRSLLLTVVTGPILLSIAVGALCRLWFKRGSLVAPDPAALAAEILLMWVMALLPLVLMAALHEWPRLRAFSRRTRMVAVAVVIGGPVAAQLGVLLFAKKRSAMFVVRDAAVWLSAALSPGLLIACAGAVFAMLYFALAKIYAESEYADRPLQKPDSYFR